MCFAVPACTKTTAEPEVFVCVCVCLCACSQPAVCVPLSATLSSLRWANMHRLSRPPASLGWIALQTGQHRWGGWDWSCRLDFISHPTMCGSHAFKIPMPVKIHLQLVVIACGSVCVCVHANACMYICVGTSVCLCVLLCAYVCVCVCKCVCVCMLMCVRKYV